MKATLRIINKDKKRKGKGRRTISFKFDLVVNDDKSSKEERKEETKRSGLLIVRLWVKRDDLLFHISISYSLYSLKKNDK